MKKRTLIFVHGFAASKKIWINQLDHFKIRGADAHAVDLLGHGDGYKPASTEEYTLDNLFQHFISSFNAMEIEPEVIFVGHSLGAYVILNCLSGLRVKASKLVLISPLLNKSQFPSLLLTAVSKPRNSAKLLGSLPLGILRSFVRADKVNANGVPETLLEQVAVDYKRADPRIAYLLDDLKPVDALEIPVPTLFIIGQKDNIIHLSEIQQLSGNFRHAFYEIIDDGGHTIHHTHPQILNKMIEDFMVDRRVDELE